MHAYYMIQQRAKASISVCWVLISSEEHKKNESKIID